MVNLRRKKKKAILHGADVEKVEACNSKEDVEKVLADHLNSKSEGDSNGASD